MLNAKAKAKCQGRSLRRGRGQSGVLAQHALHVPLAAQHHGALVVDACGHQVQDGLQLAAEQARVGLAPGVLDDECLRG